MYICAPAMKKFILILLVMAVIPAVAQKGRFHTGLIVTTSGDTLKGSISWKKNPGRLDSLQYKKDNQSDIVSYAWSSLTFFATSGGEEHIVRTVKRNLEYIDPYTFNINLADSVITEAIPLTTVFKGKKLVLYKYYGPADYFFISDGTKVVQLVQTYRYLTTNEKYFNQNRVPRYIANHIFRNQLFEYFDFDADRKMSALLENTDYAELPLKTLISRMDKKLN